VSTPHQHRHNPQLTLSNGEQVKKIRAGAVSLTTASQQSLSTETEDCLPASLPRFPCPRGKQCCANSVLQTAGREEQGNGTFPWIMSTAGDNASERERNATAAGNSCSKQWRLKVLSALGTCNGVFHK